VPSRPEKSKDAPVKKKNMARSAAEADNPAPLTTRELQTRKAFVGLRQAEVKALQALRPWMEAHVHEVVEDFYAHLLHVHHPRWLLADPPRLARVKAEQTSYLLSLREGTFDMAYVTRRVAIGRTHERGGSPAPLDLHGLLDHTVRLLEYRFQKENIAVIKGYTSDLLSVLGIRRELEQVLLDLLVNAWHAMPGGGTITVTTRRREAEASITTADTGWGIPEEHMGRLFEPFFTTKPPAEGTGLELALVHQLATGQGGHIDIASQVNEGTTVTVTLPLAERDDDA
jgi:light-regulated signal transduction histidine kinase (bacteriophytochrome)